MDWTALGKKLFSVWWSCFLYFGIVFQREEVQTVHFLGGWSWRDGPSSGTSQRMPTPGLKEVFPRCSMPFKHLGYVISFLCSASAIWHSCIEIEGALHCSPVEDYQEEESSAHFGFLKQSWAFLTRWAVFRDQVGSDLMWLPRNLMLAIRLIALQWMRSGACSVLLEVL